MNNIKFVKEIKEIEEMAYKPDKKIDSFYQICQFKKTGSRMYETRKVFFNEKGKILKVYEKEYGAKIIKKFLRDAKTNKYKMYPANSLSYIDYPNAGDMTLAQSMLTNDKMLDYDCLNQDIGGAPMV